MFPLLRSICLSLFIFLLVFLQISWPLFPKQLSLVFILAMALLFTGFSSWAWLAAIIGGLFLDLYSIFPPSLFCLSLICSLFIVYKIAHKFNITSTRSLFVLGFVGTFIYKINILFFSYLFYLLKFSDYCIILNKFYWLGLVWFMVLNTIFIFVITLGIKTIKRKVN